jgi:hypothetical protein
MRNRHVRFAFAAIVLAGAAVTPAMARTAEPPVLRLADEQIARFQGAWSGPDNPTPLGNIPFAFVFDREEDGSLHAHSAMSRETWVDLRFHRDEAGAWVLTESASLAGLGVQRYTLHPVAAAGDTLEFVHLPRPDYLRLRAAAGPEELFLVVYLRGAEHVRFRLARQTGEMEAALRRSLAEARTRPAGRDARTLQDVAAGNADPEGLVAARGRAAARPQDPQARLDLADALGEAMNGAPLPRLAAYAAEMQQALREAVHLDPRHPRARYALAQYYLQAPPIAGGSLEKAAAEADTLAGLDPGLAQTLRTDIERRRSEGASSTHAKP